MCYKYFVAILIATIASASQELPAFDGLAKSPPGDVPVGIGALFPQSSLPSYVPTLDVPEPPQTFQEDSPQKLQPLYSPEKKQNFEQSVEDYKLFPPFRSLGEKQNFEQPVGDSKLFSFPQKPSGFIPENVITPLLPVNVISNLENIPEPLVVEQPQIPNQPLGNLVLESLDEVSLAEKQDAFIPKNIIVPSLIIPEDIGESLSPANVVSNSEKNPEVSPQSSFPVTVENGLPPTPSFAFPDTKVPNIPLIPQDLLEEKTHDEPLKVFPSIQDSKSPLIPPDLFSDYDDDDDDDIGMGVYDDDKPGGDDNDDKGTGKGKGDDEGKDAADYSLSNKDSKDEGNGHDGDVGSEETSHGYGEDRGDGQGSSEIIGHGYGEDRGDGQGSSEIIGHSDGEDRSDGGGRGDVQSSSGGEDKCDSGGLKPPLPDFIFRRRCVKRSRGVRKHARRYRKNRRGVRKHARRYRKNRRGVRKHARRYYKNRRGVRKHARRFLKHRRGRPRCRPSSGGHCRRCCCPCRCCVDVRQ